MPNRSFLEFTELGSRQTFRFYFDKADTMQLHIQAAHGASPEEAVLTFRDPAAKTQWLANRRRFETVSATTGRVLAWIWLDSAKTHVMVITCV